MSTHAVLSTAELLALVAKGGPASAALDNHNNARGAAVVPLVVQVAIAGAGLTLDEVVVAAGEDWAECLGAGAGAVSGVLEPLLDALCVQKTLAAGAVPKDWTQPVSCGRCGEVKLWPGCPTQVLGCPYCHHDQRGGSGMG